MGIPEDVAAHEWYHTMDLPGGVTTPGFFDTRSTLEQVPLPASLAGKRCLDVGTCDGFWAFAMEQRGASEVVGIDVDDPNERDLPALVTAQGDVNRPKGTFGLAKSLLDSKVERKIINVYDLSEEAVGRFDFAFVGAILLHLRDPIGALMKVRDVADEVFITDVIWYSGTKLFRNRPVATLDGLNWVRWWTVNLEGLRRMAYAAGFDIVGSGGPVYVPFGPTRIERFKQQGKGRIGQRIILRKGVPHGWVHARARQAKVAEQTD